MSNPERSAVDLLSLKGKVAIITGACGWLGSSMSRALAEAGALLGHATSCKGRQIALSRCVLHPPVNQGRNPRPHRNADGQTLFHQSASA